MHGRFLTGNYNDSDSLVLHSDLGILRKVTIAIAKLRQEKMDRRRRETGRNEA
jgi:hypothetical protein